MEPLSQTDKAHLYHFPRHWHSLGQVQGSLGISGRELDEFLDRVTVVRKVEHRTSPTVAWRLRK